MPKKLELVLDAKATLAEGPSWDHTKEVLYWVDSLEKKVCIYNPLTKENRVIHLEQYVGSIAFRNQKEIVVALENGFYYLDLDSEKLTLIKELESNIANNRFNDGECDAYGRFWAGSMDNDYARGRGALYCLQTDGKVEKKLKKIGISNGIAWSLDNKYMYYIDTLTKNVCRFNYDLSTGKITNPTNIIHFLDGEGWPDGMTIDEEGMLWIAHFGGSKVSRWNPETGKQVLAVDIPALYVTSCTFGGTDLNELYITTAKTRMSAEELEQYPLSGGIFRMKPGVSGTESYTYKG